MMTKTSLHFLTFLGLYLELAGAFLLSAEAIGSNHLLELAARLRRSRRTGFVVLVVVSVGILYLSRRARLLHFLEVALLLLTLGILFDFAPKLMEFVVHRLERGKAGLIGFALFALGFILQAYVSLTQLY